MFHQPSLLRPRCSSPAIRRPHPNFVAIAVLLSNCFALAGFAAGQSTPPLPEEWLSRWNDPPLDDRPLQIVHGIRPEFAFADGVEDVLDPQAAARRTGEGMRYFLRRGRGGIVCNVAFDQYLESEDHWNTFVDGVDACARLGMVVWIYDEKGYPSGTAGGLVLRGNPEFEARVWAYAPDRPEHIFLRAAFEHMHAANNYHAVRRYVNLLDDRAVDKFIRVTHEAYRQRVGKHFGKTIRAFFTDEPSLMDVNLGPIPEPARSRVPVEDRPDPTVRPLPVVPWAYDLEAQYRNRYGEDLAPNLASLFGGNTPQDKLVRRRYWTLVGDLIADRYFGRLARWCEKNGLASSGHNLTEESLLHHVPHYGNALQAIAGMHIPGMDMLSSDPRAVIYSGWLTAAMPSSAALLRGGRRVMTEVSDFQQKMGGQGPVSLDAMQATAAWQAAWGVTEFTLYYGVEDRSIDDNRRYGDFVGRLNAVLKEALPVRRVALYYPALDMAEEYLPQADRLTLESQSPRMQRIVGSFLRIGQSLQRRQIPFVLVDHRFIEQAEQHGPELRVGNATFDRLIVPDGCRLPEAASRKIRAFTEAGGRVLFDSPEKPLGKDNAVARLSPDWFVTPEADTVCLGRFHRDDRDILLLVNVGSEPYQGRLHVASSYADKLGEGDAFSGLVLDPATGNITAAQGNAAEGWTIDLAPRATALYVFPASGDLPTAFDTPADAHPSLQPIATSQSIGEIAHVTFPCSLEDASDADGLSTVDNRNVLPNPHFTEGTDAPTGWQAQGGGRWIDRSILEIEGTGTGSQQWTTTDYRLEPGGMYRLTMKAQAPGGSGGCIVCGPTVVNKDYKLGDQWREVSHVFRVPDDASPKTPFRLGCWEHKGPVRFDEVSLVPVQPVYVRSGTLVLGEGEQIEGRTYRFNGTYNWAGTNAHRVLVRSTAGFNSTRWTFGVGDEVVYVFALPERTFRKAVLAWNVNYHVRGTCRVEVGTDGRTWHVVGNTSEVASGTAELPAELFPATTVFVRLASVGESASFQVDRLAFQAEFDGPEAVLFGETQFAEISAKSWELGFSELYLDGPEPPRNRLVVVPRNDSGETCTLTVRGTLHTPQGNTIALEPVGDTIEVCRRKELSLTLPLQGAGEHVLELSLLRADVPVASAELRWTHHELFRTDYGYPLAESEAAYLWWCESPWKVARSRPAPQELDGRDSTTGVHAAVELEAARGDHEAAQLVVTPRRTIRGLTVEVSDLIGPDGRRIGAEAIDVLRVYYHFVHTPTDETGIRGWWPDALPPLDAPVDLAPQSNQPLWILVHVPPQTVPGEYAGRITLRAEDFSAVVPIRLRVWAFALPERNHLATAFGLNLGNIVRYHGLKTEAEKRQVLDAYFRSFAEHRISPYDPVPLDHYGVTFDPKSKPPRAELDFSRFDPAMERAIARYRFTHFRLPLTGMGGGTFHQRWEPSIAGYAEGTPEYQAMFQSYLGQLTSHLREKGWLDMAYAYWFDEPDPKDYAFVRNGMERLAKYGPGLARMLTEQPEPELYGAVDIWCPVTPNYDFEVAESRRREGESFWWYVCTGPKAPYCTLFIDHPAVELRVWLWQTWKYKVEGILVWSSNYWTSSAAFPDPAHPQNPYLDPMGYVSGYSTPKGVKRHWGNGDGRFLYPPLAAADGTSESPILDEPVSSIRWEMLREGIEDYEMLYLARALLRQKGKDLPEEQRRRYETLLEVPPEITTDMTHFTTDPRPILARRKALAAMIEDLGSR